MKPYRLMLLACITLLAGLSAAAKELTSAQLQFRSTIVNFLREEGFSPTIDDDGDVSYKKEGSSYWISIDGQNPFYTTLHRAGLTVENAKTSDVLYAVNKANQYVKCGKAYLGKNSIVLVVETYFHSSEEFRYVFYSYMSSLETLRRKVKEYYEESKSGSSSTSSNSSQRSSSSGSYSSISRFFPIWGCTLGKSTIGNMRSMGYKVDTEEYSSPYADVKDFTFWDHDNDGVFESIYITESDELPQEWLNMGLNWNLSYNEIVSKFRNWGYTVNVTKEPQTKMYSGRKTLAAEVEATSADGHLVFVIDFNYGNDNGEGYSVSSKNSIYNMTIKAM